MGQSMRDIKRRIRSVKNTQQITKAMEMVSAAKLRRVQAQVLAGRPFAEKLQEALGRLLSSATGAKRRVDHPLLEARPVKKVCYVVIAADRGLAGGYNANLIRKATDTLAAEEREYELITVGRRVRDFFVKRDYPIHDEYTQVGDEIDFAEARDLARRLMDAYKDGVFDEIYLIYSSFVNVSLHRPTVTRLLPLNRPEAPVESDADKADTAEFVGSEESEELEYIYEPDATTLLRILLPRFVETLVYRALMEAKASEHGARMVAMRNASDNAEELIEGLTLSFNRARQASITTELAEIVGGANALISG